MSDLNHLSEQNINHRVYFTGSLAEQWKTKTHKDKLTSRSTVVFSLALVPGPMQLNYKKISGVNNSCGQNMYHQRKTYTAYI